MGNGFRFNPGARRLLIGTVLFCGLDGCGANPQREAGSIAIQGGDASVSPIPKPRKGQSKRAPEVRVRQDPVFPQR
jgi:hypothetical protein